MPWCDHCERFLNPNSMRSDGSCPTCGREIGRSARGGGDAGGGAIDVAEREVHPRAPWHFKLMVAALVAYLGWRLWEGLVWLAGRL